VSVTAQRLQAVDRHEDRRWQWPVDRQRYNTRITVDAVEVEAIRGLGMANLRRFAGHDTSATGWTGIGRLLQPLDDVAAVLGSPPSAHCQRAMADATAVILLRRADMGRSYWSWTAQDWTRLIGVDQQAFRAGGAGLG